MKNSRLVVIDSDSYTSSVLAEDFSRRGFGEIHAVLNVLELPKILNDAPPDVVIFNYHSDQPESLFACSTIKLLAPRCAIVAIVSPGPALKAVRAWSQQTRCVDVIIEKPLAIESFFITLEALLKLKQSSRELENKAERLANLVPEGALAAAGSDFNNEAELFEAAVLFTDIRGSSQLIKTIPPRDFFLLLNQLLSSQAEQIRKHEGSVVKYTGDGVMAIFRGSGRSHLTVRCAIDLASISSNQQLHFGIGIAEGLVLAGLIGDSNQAGKRRQYDIIGATAHLAARLCDMAEAGEIVATHNIYTVARVKLPTLRLLGNVSIKGFDKDIECVAFKPD